MEYLVLRELEKPVSKQLKVIKRVVVHLMVVMVVVRAQYSQVLILEETLLAVLVLPL